MEETPAEIEIEEAVVADAAEAGAESQAEGEAAEAAAADAVEEKSA